MPIERHILANIFLLCTERVRQAFVKPGPIYSLTEQSFLNKAARHLPRSADTLDPYMIDASLELCKFIKKTGCYTVNSVQKLCVRNVYIRSEYWNDELFFVFEP